jgi:hypothetical protein
LGWLAGTADVRKFSARRPPGHIQRMAPRASRQDTGCHKFLSDDRSVQVRGGAARWHRRSSAALNCVSEALEGVHRGSEGPPRGLWEFGATRARCGERAARGWRAGRAPGGRAAPRSWPAGGAVPPPSGSWARRSRRTACRGRRRSPSGGPHPGAPGGTARAGFFERGVNSPWLPRSSRFPADPSRGPAVPSRSSP